MRCAAGVSTARTSSACTGRSTTSARSASGLVGRSIAAWELYFSATRALGLAALLWLAASLYRRRGFALAIAFLVPWVNLRSGLALAALALCFGWLRSGRRALAAAAGGVTGAALLYSQEFGGAGVGRDDDGVAQVYFAITWSAMSGRAIRWSTGIWAGGSEGR